MWSSSYWWKKCMIIVCLQVQTTEYCSRCENIDENPSERKVWKPKSSVAAVLTLDIFLRQSFATFTFLPLSLSLSTLCPSLSNTAALDNGGKLNVQLKFMLLPVLYWNTWFDSFMLSFYFVLLQSMTGAVWNSKKKKCANAQLKIFLRSRYFESMNFQIICELILCLGSKRSFFLRCFCSLIAITLLLSQSLGEVANENTTNTNIVPQSTRKGKNQQ